MLPRFSTPWSSALCLICAVGLIGCSDESDTTGDVAKSREKSQALVPEAPAGTTAIVGDNVVLKGHVFPSGDTDLYSFTGAAGDRIYVATQTASAANGNSNTVISILDTNGTTVLETDDDDGSFNVSSSSIAGFTLPGSGTYFVSVSAVGALPITSVVLPYHLHFQRRIGAPTAEVEPNGATPQALPSGWVSGALANAADSDLYSINLAAGDTLFASLDTRAGDWDASLGIGSFGGQILETNDGGNPGPNSQAHFITVKTAGTYTVRVEGQGGDSGAYTLSLSVHPAAPQTGCTTYTNSTVTALTDNALTTSTIDVPANVTVADINVNLVGSHARPQDLDVHLVAPGGNVVGLFTDLGGAGTPNIDVTLDDEAALSINNFGMMTGMISQPEPAYRLDWFDGVPAQGTWTLRVVNDQAGMTGNLTSWGITICTPPPVPACPAGTSSQVVFTTDFEAGAAGFTHSGALDEWELGTPSFAPITNCNSGTNCFKTDLDGAYQNSSNQDLLSPPVNLAGKVAPITLRWAQKYQLETAVFDHASVDVRNADDSSPTRLFEHLGPTLQDGTVTPTAQESAGWASYTKDISSYAGNNIEVLFHVDTDTSVVLSGMAVDDVSVTACAVVCGDGLLGAGEQCDDGNTAFGDCCSPTCQFEVLGTACLDTNVCNGAEACNGAGTCVAGSPLNTDDGNACTTDACDPVTGVSNTPVTNGTACADGTVCNGAETCQAGTCTAGTALPTDDSNPCTADACDPVTGVSHTPVSDGTACLDSTVCNGAETCQAGTCTAGTALPTDDSNVCTADACDPVTGVSNTPVSNGTACLDGTVCNGAESCQAGTCTAGTALPTDDSNVCTADACDPVTGVSHTPVTNGTACLDGTVCNGAEACQAGTCTAGTALPTDDSNPCTADACDPVTGVSHTPVTNGTACADSTVCNGAETCQTGTCTAGTPPAVDDSNVCTTDACDPVTGVSNTPVTNGTACLDGTVCNGAEACQAGTCTAGTPLPTDDSNPCTADACDPVTGVSHTPVTNGTACLDGTVCNGAEACQAGTCTAGTPLPTNDNNVCTADACDPVTGVSHTPVTNGTACLDSTVCNGAESCQAGTCAAGTPLPTNDSNVCTADACDPVTGVSHTPVTNGTACLDSTVCNGAEACQAGTCTAGTALPTDDSNPCTADACDPVTGVSHTPVTNGTACADSTVCNGAETCQAGTCTAGTAPTVDDSNVCTADACDPVTGVSHTPVTTGTACDDSTLCNGHETCDATGTCAAGTAVTCTASDDCHTVGTCAAATGVCSNPTAADGTVCSVGMCLSGTCTGGGGSGGGGGAGGAAGSAGAAGTAGSGGAAGTGGAAGAAGSGGAAGAAGSGGATAGSGGRAGSGGTSNGGTSNGGTAQGGAAGDDGTAGEAGEAGAPGTGGTGGAGGSATGGLSTGGSAGSSGTGGTAGNDLGGEGGEGTTPRPRRGKAISDEESGCGCVVPGKTSQSGLPLLLGAGLLAFAVRRRRAKRDAQRA